MEKREIGFCWGSRENLISTTKPTLRVATFPQRKRFHEESSSLEEVRYEPPLGVGLPWHCRPE
jgi:hypothetical protein